MSEAWNPEFSGQSPAFAPLRAVARELHGPAWPGCDDFNRLLAARVSPIVNAAGLPLRFVAQAPRAAAFEDGYEPRIFLRGEVQFRAQEWHDVFNALVKDHTSENISPGSRRFICPRAWSKKEAGE